MAGKRKNAADNALPPRVYRGKSKFEFHPARGGSISLCQLDAPINVVWEEYHKANNYQEEQLTLEALIKQFMVSADFIGLGSETQDDYTKYSKKIMRVFGKMKPDSVKPEHVRKYMDKRGLTAKTQANREKSFLSRTYRWGYERGLVKGNPCIGVKQFKEVEREIYVPDGPYNAQLSVATVMIRVAMEISYLCAARQGDVLALLESQILEEGIFIRQGKTGKKQIKAWTPRLRAAVELARTLPLKKDCVKGFLLHQPNGRRYQREGFNAQWRKSRLAAKEAFPELDFNWTFHDLKAKGISDLEGTLSEKQHISGHKTQSQTARYDRKIPVVATVGGQKKNE